MTLHSEQSDDKSFYSIINYFALRTAIGASPPSGFLKFMFIQTWTQDAFEEAS